MPIWFDTTKNKNYHLLEQLRDTVIDEYHNTWKHKYTPEKDGIKFSDRYGDGHDLGWWGCPLVDATKPTQYSEKWPRTLEAIKKIPGVLNVCVNFIQPGHIIPEHTDDYYDMNENVVGKVRGYGTMIGINMPSNDPEVVGFQVAGVKKGWSKGEMAAFDGYQKHGGWNYSDDWRVTMIIDIKDEYWDNVE